MAVLTLDGVTKRFSGPDGDVTAVDDVSLEVEAGEFLVLVGPSGCGKTTTLRMIAGLETPTSGTVRIDGVNVTRRDPHERNIAMVFQNYALYPHMTVRENIGYGLRKSTALSDDEIAERVEEIAEMMGIGDHLENKPGQLSGGQKQRVATGRALVRDPKVFLMDEPLSNLDAKLRRHMRTEIQRIQSEFGTTTIYVTHDQEEAMTMGDRIVVMDDGRLQQVGPPEEVYDWPENRFVAEFIGNPSTNLFEVSLEGDRLAGGGLSTTLSTDPELLPDGEYALGIRPEAVELGPRDGGENDATVSVVEPTGSQAVVYLDADGHELTVQVPRDEAPAAGETVRVAIPTESIYLFDRETGESVFYGRQARVVNS